MKQNDLIFQIIIRISKMEQKKQQITAYLRDMVTPFVAPMMEEMTKEQPEDLLLFAQAYIHKRIQEKKPSSLSSIASVHSSNDIKQIQVPKKKPKQGRSSRKGISAEVYGMHNKKQQFKPTIHQKEKKAKEQINFLIEKSLILGFLKEEDRQVVVDAIQIHEQKVGNTIIKEGDQGDKLFLVGSGEYECFKFLGGKQTHLKTYKEGDSFGELALMYNSPRAATIKCSVQGKIYSIDRQTFKHIVEQSAVKRRQQHMEFLSNVEILTEIDPYEKQQICDILHQQIYQKGDYVMKQGEEGDKFYLVIDGLLIAEKNGKKVYEYKKGDYFGELALMKECKRQASIRCQTAAKVYSIGRKEFKRMLGPIEDILKRNQNKYIKNMQK